MRGRCGRLDFEKRINFGRSVPRQARCLTCDMDQSLCHCYNLLIVCDSVYLDENNEPCTVHMDVLM